MMKRFKARQTVRLFLVLLSGFVIAGCGDGGRTGHWLPGTTCVGGAGGAAADTTRPLVASTFPGNGAPGVFTNTRLTATFNEAMAPATINGTTFTLTGPGTTTVTGAVTYAVGARTATFTPAAILADNTLFTATITTGATDLAGNALAANFIWTFTTGAGGAALDNTAPTVTLTNPADNATGVATNSAVNATFSEAMNPSTISTATFTVTGPGVTPVAGTVTLVGLIATFTPTSILADNTLFTATITTGATDLSVPGNALDNGVVPNPWTFTTGTGTGTAPGAVALGSAAGFGIMATSAITNTGAATIINGDVALDPGTSNGLLPAQVNGTIHINDAVSALARADLLVAYNSAKALPPGTTVTAGADLGAINPGGVLPPGTYTSGSTMLVSTPLVLDAGGNANAVWVFQIGSSLTTNTPLGNVSLLNGAQAKNVFWVPTASATIGVGTTFYGTIIAGVSATGQTGATINGRLLAGAIGPGTIALDTNTVNVPAP